MDTMREDWDVLIILDACRYDYFEKVYRNYVTGNLKKVISPGSHTIEWLKRVFKKQYDDVVYVSANPYISSKVEVSGFNAKNHFYRVIDVWDWGWSEKLGTVHPKEVNRAAQKAKEDYPDKRFIIHYMQPHTPYLSLGVLRTVKFDWLREFISKPIKGCVRILGRGRSILRHKRTWKFWQLLGRPPTFPMEAELQKVGENGLRQAYEENLRTVLKYVVMLLEELSGNIIITADHGELLGERGIYEHYCGSRMPALTEVPWLKVEKPAKPKREIAAEEEEEVKEPFPKEDEERVRARLRALGYID